MNGLHNRKLSENAKKLRREMTAEERHIWYDFLKSLPHTVHRQKVIGRYIVDFYIACAKIAIEIDGSQHYEEKGKQEDQIRDKYLKALKLTVLRYSNRDIHCNFEGVCRDILYHIDENIKRLPLEGKLSAKPTDEV